MAQVRDIADNNPATTGERVESPEMQAQIAALQAQVAELEAAQGKPIVKKIALTFRAKTLVEGTKTEQLYGIKDGFVHFFYNENGLLHTESLIKKATEEGYEITDDIKNQYPDTAKLTVSTAKRIVNELVKMEFGGFVKKD